MKSLLPTKALALLLAIGFVDLVTTAVLHRQGAIQEMNPLMRPIIEQSEWSFVGVKGLTLIGGWAVMVWYSKQNLAFVRSVCLYGSLAYASIWFLWFIGVN